MQQSPSWEANPILSQSRNSPHFMENGSSLPQSQHPATCNYPEPDRSIPRPPSQLLKIHFNITLPSTPVSSKQFLSLRFPHQTLYSPLVYPIRVTWPYFIMLLHFITIISDAGSDHGSPQYAIHCNPLLPTFFFSMGVKHNLLRHGIKGLRVRVNITTAVNDNVSVGGQTPRILL